MFLDCSVNFFDVVVGIPRVENVHAHQLDALLVDQSRRCDDGSLVDVLCVNDILLLLLVQCVRCHIFPDPMNTCLWCVSQISDLAGLQVSVSNTASHLYLSSSHIISSIFSLE